MTTGNKRCHEETISHSDLAALIQNLSDKFDRQFLTQEEYKEKFSSIESRLDTVEREVNKKALIISGVQPSKEEDLPELVANIARSLAVPINKNEIDDIWRFGRDKQKVKVVFLRSITKRTLLKKVREKKKLSTKDIGLSYEAQVYLNEDLGAGASHILYKARQLKRASVIYATWSAGGRVFYKLEKEGTPCICHSLSDLEALEGKQEESAEPSAAATDDNNRPPSKSRRRK